MKGTEYQDRRRETLWRSGERRFLATASVVLAGLTLNACSAPAHKGFALLPPPTVPGPSAATQPVSLLATAAPTAAESGDIIPSPASRNWSVVAGETVPDTLRRWSRQAGYTPVPRFTAHENWHLFVTEDYQGSFEQALQWLSDGFSRYDRKPLVELHANRTLDLLSMPGDGTVDGEVE